MGEGKQQLGWLPCKLARAGGKPSRRVPAVAGPRGVNVHGVSSKLAAVEEVQGMREVDLQVCWAAWLGLLGPILGTVGLEKGLKISWKFGLKMGRNR